MFAIALAVSFTDRGSPTDTVDALLDAWPCSASDGRAIVSAPHAAAGVLRWAVVDRDRRVAPLWDPERQLLFVGDVRLYNRRELGRELDLGDGGAELSDAELAWRAYLRWGEDAARHLIGDFAFAVWDERRRSIFAARDHLGVRPLYYKTNDGGAHVASDVHQLLAITPEPSAEINAQTILERFSRGRRTNGLTFFRSISALPGGHVITIARGTGRSRRFWRPSFGAGRDVDNDDHAEIRALFRRAVSDRIESDHPIVAHMSGGFDSSAILMIADQLYGEAPDRPPLVMASAMTPGMPCDDSFYVDVVARRLRFESVRWNALEPNLADLDEPVIAYPGLRRGTGGGARRDLELARERDGRVLLHGFFGDGLAYAFGVSRDMFRTRSWRALGRHLRASGNLRAQAGSLVRSMTGVLPPALALRVSQRIENRAWQRAPKWMGPELRARWPPPPEELELEPVDWPSHLACDLWSRLTGPRTGAVIEAIVSYGTEEGIEVRLPYLDVRLAEKLLAVPWQERLPQRGHNPLGREIFRSLLPVEFSRRTRGSWTQVWVLGARRMLPSIGRMLSDGTWLSAPYVDVTEARTLFARMIAEAELADPKELFLVSRLGALEAWLRQVFRYDAGRKEIVCPISQ
jgi:asparagine synthase (glutamine-hydrolysing)